MIRLLHGTIHDTNLDSVTVLVNGVGYLVFTPQPEQHETGSTVIFHTHHAIRETALDLYGFLSADERDLFEQLLRVPKVGPKSALQVMTQASLSLLIEAINKNDAAYLHKLSGIGKKTCENIMVQLHDKLPASLASLSLKETTDTLSQTQADAIDALIALGYDASSAKQAVQSLPNQSDDTTVNQLVTHALKEI